MEKAKPEIDVTWSQEELDIYNKKKKEEYRKIFETVLDNKRPE